MFNCRQSTNTRLTEFLKKRRENSTLTLRMAPLIDVIFLLLIFFFVSLRFKPLESYLPAGLPAAASGPSAAVVEPLLIRVTGSGGGCKIQFGQNAAIQVSAATVDVDMAAAVQSLQAVMIRQKRTIGDPVELIFDNKVRWDYTAKIYNLLFGLGIKDITFRLND